MDSFSLNYWSDLKNTLFSVTKTYFVSFNDIASSCTLSILPRTISTFIFFKKKERTYTRCRSFISNFLMRSQAAIDNGWNIMLRRSKITNLCERINLHLFIERMNLNDVWKTLAENELQPVFVLFKFICYQIKSKKRPECK